MNKQSKKMGESIRSPEKNDTVIETCPIVAIGASAGGLDALIQFFKPITIKSDMAFIVVTHLDPDHKSIMPELLQSHTHMQVLAIDQGSIILPNSIYVIPPNKNVLIKDNLLMLVDQDEPHYANLPINYFFHSLALNYGKNVIAVVLSGCGYDGSLGVREVKQHGGLVVVQDPQTAQYDGMPRNAINTNQVDYIASPDKLFYHIKRLLNISRRYIGSLSEDLNQLFMILKSTTGHDFSGYKTSVLKRRIDRQRQRLHLHTISDYVQYLKKHPGEANLLFTDLLIGVTCFFRDNDAFHELKHDVFPLLFKNKPATYVFRIWAPGCSTGEEVYSLAILLREYMQENNCYVSTQLFGTDINTRALEIARAGIYPETIDRDVSQERLTNWFIKEKSTYKIKKEIRDMIVFGAQNLIQDPPFTKLDLISCRNVLIYLNAAAQRKLFTIFHYSLKPQGVLFLGKSEAASQYINLFKPLGEKCKFFERSPLISTVYTDFNLPLRQNLLRLSSFVPNDNLVENNNVDLDAAVKELLINKYVSPCIVVNNQGEILFIHGDLSSYLSTHIQLIYANILDVAPEHIKSLIMPLFCSPSFPLINTSMTKSIVDPYSTEYSLKLTIKPIHNIAGLKGLILLRFERTPLLKKIVTTIPTTKNLLDVEKELTLTRENLQATIEELEASNEEMQSTNEEFQSINEELETSKEELQSVNEELLIVNTELQNRIEQLAAVNDDMNNLFNSTDIAAVFLDNRLLIKRFTPQVQDLIHLIPADIGRSFKHFASNIKNSHLVESSEEVIKTLRRKTFEVQSQNDRWYLVNILPYRTLLNMIDGVVITFIDITQSKLDEEKILELNRGQHYALSFLDDIIDAVPQPLMILDLSLQIVSINTSCCNLFALKKEDSAGQYFYEISDNQWNIAKLRELLDRVILENFIIEKYEVDCLCSDVGQKKLSFNARKIVHKTAKDLIIIAITRL